MGKTLSLKELRHGLCILKNLASSSLFEIRLKELRNGWRFLKKLTNFFFHVRRSQSILIILSLYHPCSCLVSYYLFSVFLP